jgi:hypothetical protein
LNVAVIDPVDVRRTVHTSPVAAAATAVGRASGVPLTGPAWPAQALEPLYVWNNRHDGLVDDRVLIVGYMVQAGRDFITGRCRPGYVPFAYPHPLTGAPSVPTRLTCP